MHRVRVCIADDHIAIRDRAVQQLAHEFDVVGAVGDGQALLDAAAALDPDVVILDISMPALDGIKAAERLQETGCRAKIVFLTVHEIEYHVIREFFRLSNPELLAVWRSPA